MPQHREAPSRSELDSVFEYQDGSTEDRTLVSKKVSVWLAKLSIGDLSETSDRVVELYSRAFNNKRCEIANSAKDYGIEDSTVDAFSHILLEELEVRRTNGTLDEAGVQAVCEIGRSLVLGAAIYHNYRDTGLGHIGIGPHVQLPERYGQSQPN